MEIDFSKSLYELVSQYPEMKEIMLGIGFNEITKPGMLQTAGRYMTIPKGEKIKKIPLPPLFQPFKKPGFQFAGEEK